MAVVRQVLLRPGLSRSDLALRLELTRTTIGRVVRELIAEGWLAERTRPTTGHSGRRPLPLAVDDARLALLGADAGPEGARVVATTLQGDVLATASAAYVTSSAQDRIAALLQALEAVCDRLGGQRHIAGLGIGLSTPAADEGITPGGLDGSFAHALSARLARTRLAEVPLFVRSPVDAAALAEVEFNAEGAGPLLYLSLGPGLHAGLVVDGALIPGRSGGVGRARHMVLKADGPVCACGRRGCAETLVGAHALLAASGAASVAELRRRIAAGERVALRSVEDAGRHLGVLLHNLACTFDPAGIVLGGSLLALGAPLLEPALHTLQGYAAAAGQQAVKVRTSRFGEQAVAVGAAALVRAGLTRTAPPWVAVHRPAAGRTRPPFFCRKRLPVNVDISPGCDGRRTKLRDMHRPGPQRSLVALASSLMLAACGSGGAEEGKVQAISFDYPGGSTLLTPPQTLKATATSGLRVSFQSTTPSICTVSGDQMTLVSEGQCRIVASQGGGTDAEGVKWAPAPDSSQLFNVLKHPQTVVLEAPDYVMLAQTQQVVLKATASSGLPISYSVGTPAVCSLSGSTLTLLTKGSCLVTAAQPGDANYVAVKADAYVAVDPLILADGITGAGQGSTSDARTRQGGAVRINPWGSMVNAWGWCDRTDDTCFRSVSDDGRIFTSSFHIPKSAWTPGGWQMSGDEIDIFGPGLTDFAPSGDTVSGVQVTTETMLAMTLGTNPGLFRAKKPMLLHLDLGKRNGDCHVTVSTLVWPAAAMASYGIPLSNFAVTEACGLPDVKTASVDDVKQLPNPYMGATPSEQEAAQKAFEAALDSDKIKPGRDSAGPLIKNYNIVRLRLRMDLNTDYLDDADGTYYGTDLSFIGAIKVQ